MLSTTMENNSTSERTANSIILAEKLFAAIKTERKEDVEKYLCLGADPNQLLLNGITPFHLASGCSKSFEFVRLILEHDGNPNVRDCEGITPFHVATQWGKKQCLKLLIHHGADLLLKDNDGKDIFRYAEENGIPNFAAVIRDYCLEKEKWNSPFKTPDHSFDQSQDSLSIRSPLHSLCDVSWIVKSRGSKRRHRLISERSSKENSPVKAPRNERTNSASDCTRCKDYRTPCKDYKKACCVDKPTTPCLHFCGVQANAISPCISNGCCSNFNYAGRVCTNNDIPRSNCSVFRSPAAYKSQDFPNYTNAGCKQHKISKSCASCNAPHDVKHGNRITAVSAAYVQTSFSVDGDCTAKKRVMNRDDKCIGTSLVESFVHPAKQSKVSMNKDKSVKNTSSGFYEDAVSNSSDTKMEESVKGCQQFISNEIPKGLDMSSPVHCESFTIDKMSELSDNLASPNSQVEVLENKISDDSGQASPTAADQESLEIKNNSEMPSNTLKSASVVSPRKKMLFSTKIPLTFEEMVKCYGVSAAKTIHSSSFLSQSQQDDGKDELNTVENPLVKTKCPMKDESNFTLYDSTVLLESNSSTVNATVQKNLSAMKELQTKGTFPPLNKDDTSLDLKGTLNGLSTDITVNSAPTNLHSTAIEESNKAIQNLCEISKIKETTADIRLHVDEDGISWVEEHTPSVLQIHDSRLKKQACSALQLSGNSNSSSQSTIIYDWKTFWKGESLLSKPTKSCSQLSTSSGEECTAVENLEDLTDAQIRCKLLAYGIDPGPINPNRKFYLARLKGLMQAKVDGEQTPLPDRVNIKEDAELAQFSKELNMVLSGKSLCEKVISDDESVQRQFEQPDANLKWREGTTKSSFTYLLLDPRVTDKLSVRAKDISELEAFKSFVGAIFYVGKGKHSRPYSHFHEALQTNALLYKLNPSQKVRHIHDIWEAGYGVVSLHIFQNVIACEAYTREAAMIDAIGLLHLTNRKRGDYYGPAASWNMERKRLFGSYLVMKAMKVLLLEGERQIRPANLKSKNKNTWTGCQ